LQAVIAIALLFFALLSSCIPYRCGQEAWLRGEASERECALSDHSLYRIVPRHRSQIRWYDLPHWGAWALFGNDDDGLWGEVSFPDQEGETVSQAAAWWIRNPFHNLFFYVVGSAHCSNSEVTLLALSSSKSAFCSYQPVATTNFFDEGSCFYLGLHGWKPFCSFRLQYSDSRRCDCYLGWRERGNFGGKLLPFSETGRVDEMDEMDIVDAVDVVDIVDKVDG